MSISIVNDTRRHSSSPSTNSYLTAVFHGNRHFDRSNGSNAIRIIQLDTEISNLFHLDTYHLHEDNQHHIDAKLDCTAGHLAVFISVNPAHIIKITNFNEKKFQRVLLTYKFAQHHYLPLALFLLKFSLKF
jgi:hypothetical protein